MVEKPELPPAVTMEEVEQAFLRGHMLEQKALERLEP